MIRSIITADKELRKRSRSAWIGMALGFIMGFGAGVAFAGWLVSRS